MFNMTRHDLSNFLLGALAMLFISSVVRLSAVDIAISGSLLVIALYERTKEVE